MPFYSAKKLKIYYFGETTIYFRCFLYNQEFGADALSFEIIDLKDNEDNALGTKVIFKIKVMEEE